MWATLFVSAGPICFRMRRFTADGVFIAFSRPGSDLLSRVLRRSTIGAGAFHGRVRNGNGCGRPAITTRSAKGNVIEKLAGLRLFFLNTLFLSVFTLSHPLDATLQTARQTLGDELPFCIGAMLQMRRWQPYSAQARRPSLAGPSGACFTRQDKTDGIICAVLQR